MISYKLWHVLRRELPPAEFRRILRLDQPEKHPRFWNIMAALAVLMFAPLLLVFVLPACINFLCLQSAVQIATAIERQHRFGRHAVIAVTPLGEMGFVLQVAQTYCRSMTYSIGAMGKVWGFVVGGALIFFPLSGADLSDTLLGVAYLAAIIAVLFIDYAHCVTWAMVVGIIAGMMGKAAKAQISAFAGYFAVQLLWYIALAVVLMATSFGSFAPAAHEKLLLFVATLLVFCGIREAAVAMLWRKICERSNEDLPALKVMLQQG